MDCQNVASSKLQLMDCCSHSVCCNNSVSRVKDENLCGGHQTRNVIVVYRIVRWDHLRLVVVLSSDLSVCNVVPSIVWNIFLNDVST